MKVLKWKFIAGDYYILADSAYPLRKEVMVPYKDNGHLTRNQKEFNRKLSSCRIVVEHAFGELKQRFRQLYFLKLRKVERIVKVIHSGCVLHNLTSSHELVMFEDPPEEDLMPSTTENQGDSFNIEVVYNDRYVKLLIDDLCANISNQTWILIYKNYKTNKLMF